MTALTTKKTYIYKQKRIMTNCQKKKEISL